MSAIIIERPGGRKPPFFSKQNMLLGTWAMLAWLAIIIVVLVKIPHPKGQETNALLISLLAVIALIVPLAWIFWTQIKRELKDYTELFNSFGDEVLHRAPTHLGWVACGADWIGTAIYPNSLQRLSGTQIDNIFWGNPGSNGHSRLNNDFCLNLDHHVFDSTIKFFWLIAYSSAAPSKSIVVTFRKQAERDEWLEIAKSVKAGHELEIQEPCPCPTSWQLACKARVPMIAFTVTGIFVLFIAITIYSTYHNGHADVFQVATMLFMAIPGFSLSTDKRPSATRFTLRTWFLISGGDVGTLYTAGPGIADGMLFLELGSLERIAIAEIGKVKLEDWGHDFVTRDLSKLFSKNDPSKKLVIRLYLDQKEDQEREIKLDRDDAIAWHKALTDLVASK